ncbi:hypothetical protein ABC347_03655 [Sphingomonas sp. 1P06PA]|uniref:hypothetical protein n=1 Tax=Sphingomonas sp. 1P06PA TaxID=554121 RepID=UPI0039A65352
MPGPLLHQGAIVSCVHGGSAQPTAPNVRVLVSGQPVVTVTAPWLVAGCPFNVAGAPLPCVSAQFVSAAARVTSLGQPLLLLDSQAVTVPNAVPLVVAGAQPRVTAI